MEAAPSAKPRREPPPIPSNYVSLRQLQELRLKEEEEQEKRQREEEEAAAAAVKREAALKAAMAAAAKREAALKAETKGRAASSDASGGAKGRRRGGQEQGHGHQWVAVPPRPAAVPPRPVEVPPTPRVEGAAGKREGVIGGGRREKGPADGGGKPVCKKKGKSKEKLSAVTRAETRAVDEPGRPAEAIGASSQGGKPENKGKRKAKEKASRDQAAESGSKGGGPGESAVAANTSSQGPFRSKGTKGAGGRSAETSRICAPTKTAGASLPRGVKSENPGKPRPPGPRHADAGVVASSDSSDGKKAAPDPTIFTSSAEGSSNPSSGGELRKNMEAKPKGLVEWQHRRQAVEVQAVAELKPRVVRSSAGPRRGPGNGATEQHGRVWVPKTAATAGSSGCN